MAFKPRKQMTPHNRTERNMTRFASKLRLRENRFVELWLCMEGAGELAELGDWLSVF
ncbi:unnamed protein product [Lupinus luteus]|uniref:Uncharacterized protein n=1 Tax=Lupinus luteus TaxID=3873 RepID=A0AAV1WBL0_LUPLU